MRNFIGIFTLLVVFTAGCQQTPNPAMRAAADPEKPITPEQSCGQTPPDEPYTLPDLGHGLIQSPINILSKHAELAGKHSVELHFDDQINAIEKLGHTVQLDFKEGSTLIVDGKSYQFKQLHFHTPSEHLIDGMTFPMEMHIVNVAETKAGEPPEFLVVGVLFKMGAESQFISEFLDLIPTEESKRNIRPGLVRLHDLFSQHPEDDLSQHYHYRGSLTTPPYTESVSWYIDKTIFEASPEQIQAINQIEGNNARHIQATYGRKVDR